MKKYIFLSLSLIFGFSSSYAQNAIQLNIHHKLGEKDFAFNVGAKNNIDHDFNCKRLQYYISEISLVHDGGVETPIDEVVLLVSADQAVEVDLGSFDIEQVEKIRLHLGVAPELNHLDPATYPADHPLAPQFPSMHWGWTSGYRFMAIEGKSGPSFNQVFELHALGDFNYHQVEVEVNEEVQNGQLIINLNADYTRILEDILINNGVFIHGEGQETRQAMQNFRDFVFSSSSVLNTATTDKETINKITLSPNPAFHGQTQVLVADADPGQYEIQVTDQLGRLIKSMHLNTNTSELLNLEQPGFYWIRFLKDGQFIGAKKLISQ